MARYALVCILALAAAAQPRLSVSGNGRHLVRQDGRPFFWLGDTAWELFHRLNREEASHYLADRAAKGFTVIQAVVLSQIGGLDVPNANGHLPLVDKDPAKPVEEYFRHVDFIVDRAAAEGLWIGMLPTWGSYWSRRDPERKPIFDAANARAFGVYLGRRYRARPVIWILGGDETIRTKEERAVIDAMAAGLAEGDGGTHLKTFHPRGPGLSSIELHSAPWLDFNMVQSSHGARDHDNGLYIEHDRALSPPKPSLDGEPRYEIVPVGFYFRNYNRYERFDDADVRQAAYWSLLAGACGHTYGNNSIWQMWRPGLQPLIFADIPWRQALQHPGAAQMGYLRRLFESRPWHKLVPDQSIIKNGPLSGPGKIRAARASDASFAFIYTPRGEAFTLDKSIINAERVREIWWDPRYGVAHEIHVTDRWGFQTYTPPTSGRGQDWVLILEDAAAAFPAP
jgi:hypothetical protein